MIICWLLGNFISRKIHLIIGSLFITLSCFLQLFNISTNKYFHYSINCLGGIGTAFLRIITPIYLAELATKSKRGMIISAFQTMKYFGRVLALGIIMFLIHHDNQKYVMSEEDMRSQWDRDHNPRTFQSETFSFPYKPSNYSSNILKVIKVFPCIIFLLLIFFFIPNSPRYLFYSKHYNKAFKTLYRLYTPKKLVTISDEDLPPSFFQKIHRYHKKIARWSIKNFPKSSKIVPITEEEEEKLVNQLEFYNSSIYTNEDFKNKNKKKDNFSSNTLISPQKRYYSAIDEEDQIDNFIENMEKSKEEIKKAEVEKREKEKKKKENDIKKMKKDQLKREEEELKEKEKKKKRIL
ncbi:hypothetical protein BCR36DRAFT_349439 [Piromyces finnis]|uniref:Major facilitator superfamily (MFS) profile domain-containing protein n=1 Tax=Piromyces finnis TaxID=1754191 RepID=A0A1Y1VEC4_9FUNG|nr:hypothetical protein BCR36DRAFT_349439 [Piromyces finnis]|eukprot:ORX53454.1 hypothetical protein BCR36DRAFT_349439 [Piromyces finnis]